VSDTVHTPTADEIRAGFLTDYTEDGCCVYCDQPVSAEPPCCRKRAEWIRNGLEVIELREKEAARLAAFVERVRAEEREACAEIVKRERERWTSADPRGALAFAEAAIRARGEKR